jgi:hypothetical protein
MKKLCAALLLCAATALAQVGTISTGGLGGPGSFGARGFGGPGHVFVPRAHPFGGCCGPSVSVNFGHHPRVGVHLNNFGPQYLGFGGYAGGLLNYWYDEPPSTAIQQENPPSALPRQYISHYEEHVPAAPLIIEREGDRWVRRRVVEAQIRPGEPPQSYSDTGDQLQSGSTPARPPAASHPARKARPRPSDH